MSESNQKIIGFTCGAMDLLHAGHISMLEECRTQCDYLVVGLHTDPSVDRPEKNKPIQSTYERYVQLRGCRFVDQIIPYDTEDDLLQILKIIQPNVRFIGGDWEGRDFTGKELDIPVVYNHRTHKYSTTELRDRICNR